ncbi:unnamed protein product, partial [Laminaria digitata]
LSHASRVAACELLDSLGLDDTVFGDLCSFHADVMDRLDEDAPYALALAALALGRGHGIDEDPGPVCAQYRKQLDLSNTDRDAMISILEIARAMHTQWDRLGIAGKRRLGGRVHADLAMALYEAWCAVHGSVRAHTIGVELARWAGLDEGLCPAALIAGGDLIAMGLEPGPAFRAVLDAVYDAQLEGRVTDRDGALALAGALA